MPIPIEILRKAWMDKRTGRLDLTHETRPSAGPIKDKPRIEKYGIIKDKKSKMILTVSSHPTHIDVVAFPKLEHLEAFKAAAKGVMHGGTADFYPGSIGAMHLLLSPMDVSGHSAVLLFIQSHFKTKQDAPGQRVLSRPLATKYGGWRHRCLDMAVEFALGSGRLLVVPKHVASRGTVLHDLDKVCLAHDLKRFGGKEAGKISYWRGGIKVVEIDV
ncbi:MAG: hypothetical protein V1676_04435 [Candidatus Diapherotrites archaeon]